MGELRRSATLLLAASMLTGCATARVPSAADTGGNALHRALLVLDSHVDIPPNFATPVVDPRSAPRRQVDLDGMVAGGLDAAFFVVYVPQASLTPAGHAAARDLAQRKFDAIHRMVAANAGTMALARSAAEVRSIVGSGRRAVLVGIENGYAIGTDLALLARYHSLGARYLGLTHNGNNALGGSARPSPELGDLPDADVGLSLLGRQAVAELNRLGILVDVSHANRRTMFAAVASSNVPVIASHTAARALADHPRNLDDAQLRAIKANGGVVQIVAVDGFLKSSPERQAALAQLARAFGAPDMVDDEGEYYLPAPLYRRYHRAMADLDRRYPGATVSDLADHIDHAVKLIGIGHVGIASDFGGGGGIEGWRNARETPNVTRELLRRGYTRDDLAKLWGGNLLRVLEAAEIFAARQREEQ